MRTFVALLFVVLAPGVAMAAPEDVANAVAHQVMSPYCPGVTLHDCPSAKAQEMRETITAWAKDGMTKEAIIDRLEEELGPSIRALPSGDGAGLLAWLLPGLAVAGGAGVAVVLARRWARREAPVVAPGPPATAEAGARLRAELDRMRRES